MPVTDDLRSLVDHCGKEVLKSGSAETPGHMSSSGVPRRLEEQQRRCIRVSLGIRHDSCDPTHQPSLPEYSEDLVNFRVTWEQGLPLGHLSKDAADGPGVDTCRVVP